MSYPPLRIRMPALCLLRAACCVLACLAVPVPVPVPVPAAASHLSVYFCLFGLCFCLRCACVCAISFAELHMYMSTCACGMRACSCICISISICLELECKCICVLWYSRCTCTCVHSLLELASMSRHVRKHRMSTWQACACTAHADADERDSMCAQKQACVRFYRHIGRVHATHAWGGEA